MSYTYQIHPLVEEDFYEGYSWYESKQKGLGERFIDTVDKKVQQILLNPEAYSSKGHKSFREVEVETFPYLMFIR